MKPLSAMNVIPFIDIMLVLLAVVLTTATFVAQGRIPVRLPAAEQIEPMPTARSVEIAVREDGGLFVDGREVTLERLDAELAALDAGTTLLLRVDEQSAFRHFVSVIDTVKAHALDRVSIVAARASR